MSQSNTGDIVFSANLITYYLNPYIFTESNNLGTNILSDFYFDFGIFSVIIGMFICGYMFRVSDLVFFSKGNISVSLLNIFGFVYFF